MTQIKSLKTSLIDLDAITHCTLPPARDKMVKLMLALGGTTRPPIVRYKGIVNGIERYELVTGLSTIANAIRAYELDDDFEMIRCYVAYSDDELELLLEMDELYNS